MLIVLDEVDEDGERLLEGDPSANQLPDVQEEPISTPPVDAIEVKAPVSETRSQAGKSSNLATPAVRRLAMEHNVSYFDD